MSDKPVAFLVAAGAVAPICAVCVLGPAAIGAALDSAVGWLTGNALVGLALLALAIGGAVYVHKKRKRAIDAGPAPR